MLTVNTVSDVHTRKQALNVQESFIVQAPAGSGKTSLLTQRILALLGQAVTQPEECLSITFTRKAAAEMQERVLQALHAAQRGSENKPLDPLTLELALKVLERDQKMGWHLLDNPNRLQIQTIDSFCAQLAQQSPLVSGVGAFSKVMSDANHLYEEAVENVLENLESTHAFADAIQNLLLHLDNDWTLIQNLLINMLSHRDQWLFGLGRTFFNQVERHTLEEGLQLAVLAILNQLVSNIPPVDIDFFSLVRFAAEQVAQFNPHSKITSCLTLNHWPKANLASLPQWQGLAELLLTEKNQFRKTLTFAQGFPAVKQGTSALEKKLFQENKERMQAFLAEFKKYPEFELALEELKGSPQTHYTDEQWAVLESLTILLPVLVAELLIVFQKRGQVDFIEVAMSADRALGDSDQPSELAFKLGYQLRHILVDEFQDTSLFQFRLLEKLTTTFSSFDGNTLFLVGDPMQSIYRFRRAEVGLFITAKDQGLNQIKLRPMHLYSNFRSDPKIIEWVNGYFADRFPKEDDAIKGSIGYTACVAKKNASPEAEVHIYSVNAETEAKMVLDCLHKLQKQDPKSSTAILMRSRTHLKNILPILKKEGIFFQGVDLDLLKNRPVILDLLSLARALVHLGDRIAWLSLLRAPYFDLALEDIEKIANHTDGGPLLLDGHRGPPLLSEHAQKKLNNCLPILNNALSERERFPFVLWLKRTWEALFATEGCEHHQPALKLAQPDVDRFFTILREHGKTHDLFKIGVLEDCFKNGYAEPSSYPRSEFGVQIMTIHKAKGLEFDNVLLIGMNRSTLSEPNKLLLWEERPRAHDNPYLILAPIRSLEIQTESIYQYLRRQEKSRMEAESLRLLYVAATRAKKRFYGFSYETD